MNYAFWEAKKNCESWDPSQKNRNSSPVNLEKEQFEASILDKITSGGVKKHCMAAYNWLVKGVKLYLSSPEARDAFMKNQLLSQVHLPDTDMMVEVDREIEHQKFVLLNLTDDTTKGRLITSLALADTFQLFNQTLNRAQK